jgi:hypothetical protein
MRSDDTFTLHAVHPIPFRYLRQLSPPQLEYLAEYLLDDGVEISQDVAVLARGAETIARVDWLLRERIGGEGFRERLEGLDGELQRMLPEGVTFEDVVYPGLMRRGGGAGGAGMDSVNSEAARTAEE